MSDFTWQILKRSNESKARTGIIKTPHGKIYTPAFIFCGTKAALKSVSTQDALLCGTQIILSNTYHLMLQPGSELIAKHGGLHKFMNWKGPMLTDSGGFQIFSLGYGSVADEIKGRNSRYNKSLIKVLEEGALFKSYLDGSVHLLSPEKSIEIQRNIGADLILVFDECTPFHIQKKKTYEAMVRSHNWSKRSINFFQKKNIYDSCAGSAGNQKLYGIIQGGVYKDFREESIEFNLKNLNFFGLAIGGSLGSSKDEMKEIIKYTSSRLSENRPTHLLGIGEPNDIWNCVKYGIDTFDCVSPTRLARHGSALIKSKSGKINLKNKQHKDNLDPIDVNCKCKTCQNYSQSYLHHLIKSDELVFLQLISIHNIFFMNELMKYIRNAINNDNLEVAESNWYLN